MKVWILTDHYEDSGVNSIIGVFANETDAKLALAEYILDSDSEVLSQYIDLECFEIIGGEE
ncbi:hypothetical protein [Tepidimicrobium xylanilyticum]|uniref:hypothetical protein n=1 Tax=Tepidimicrobium xylanilyticum TaxID=1123352 RepID=UPI002655CF11|nr:hypothetical protein [Tepidimicrobium xylanilyticum]GMG96820.1 hypothetical protein EN5CB1_16460 [Tepidimicrobium xylanilyticum]